MNKKRIFSGIVLALLAIWIVVCQVVIAQAKEYYPGPDIACAQVVTRAVHVPTGALHTFSNGCLPPGWNSL